MIRYIMVRVSWIFIILFIVLTLNFTLLKLAPAYPPTQKEQQEIYYARQVIDGYMTEEIIDDLETVNAIRIGEYEKNEKYFYKDEVTQYRVYKPIPIISQYFSWLKNIVTKWDWGLSTRVEVNAPAFKVLAAKIPDTLRLNIISLLFYIPIGFGLGILAALRSNKLTDNVISVGVMIFISIPSFVLMTVLVIVFGYWLNWVPTQFVTKESGPLLLQITSHILPVIALSLSSVAGLTRLTRSELKEVLTSDFLLLARTKGLTKNQAVIRHAMRNSMVPLVPSIIGSFVGLLSGSVIIENIYGIPGTGRVFLNAMAANNLDYNVILAVTAFYTTISLFAILLVDLSYGLVDPRIRMGAKK